MINSLYNDVKYEYMCRNFFVNDKLATDIASIFFIIENIESMFSDVNNKKSLLLRNTLQEMNVSKMLIDSQKQLQVTFLNFIPLKTYKRLMKPKEMMVGELRAKISERILKNEYSNIYEMKLNLLNIFSKFPEFLSTNYQVVSKERNQMRISINAMYIYIENAEETEFIHLEKIVTIMPKSKYILLYYHKQENLVTQLPIFCEEKLMFAIVMDILSYCSLRIKMSSINLYEIYNLESTEAKMVNLQQSLRKVYDKEVEKDLVKSKEDFEAGYDKIKKMSLTLMLFKELQYFNKNNYIKTEVNRKLYANKSQKKLQIQREFDEEEQQEITNANKKIMEMFFPKAQLKVEEEEHEEQQPQQMKKKKFNVVQDDSFDYRKEYDKLNF